jgi:hypothetical protein
MKSNTKQDNKLQNEIEVTRHNIKAKLFDPDYSIADIEAAMGRYKHVAAALNLIHKDTQTTLLSDVLTAYLTTTGIEQRLKQLIELFLRKGAKGSNIPNGANPPVSPMFLLYDIPRMKGCTNPNKYKTADVLELFLNYPEHAQAKHTGQTNLAHLTAFSDLASLKLVYKVAPHLVEERCARGATALFYALEANDEAAFWLINEAKVRLDVQDKRGISPFSIAVMLGKTELARLLLDKGCPIYFDHHLIKANNENRALIALLEESGYFLEVRPDVKSIYFTCTNNNKIHKITSQADLQSLGFPLPQKQVQRLHASFLEALNTSKPNLHTQSLYTAFKQKFPNTDLTLHPPAPEVNQTQGFDDPDTIRFATLAFLELLSNSEEHKLATTYKELKEHLNNPCLAQLTGDNLQHFIKSFEEKSLSLLRKGLADDQSIALEFSALAHHEFNKNMLLRYVEEAPHAALVKHHHEIIYLLSFGALALLLVPEKQDQILHLMMQVERIYEAKNLPSANLNEIKVVNMLGKLPYYFERGFYEEALHLVLELNEYRTLFTKEHSNFSWAVSLNFLKAAGAYTFVRATDQWALEQQWEFVNVVESLASSTSVKNSFEERSSEVLQKTRDMRAGLVAHYSQWVNQWVSTKSTVLSFKLNPEHQSIDLVLEQGVDAKLVGQKIRAIEGVQKFGTDFCIKYLGKSPQAVTSCITALVSITSEPLPEERLKPVELTQHSDADANSVTPQYLPSPAFLTTATASKPRASKATSSKQEHSSQNAEKTVTIEHDLEALKQRIRTRLNLGPEVEIYPLRNPLFPKTRQHVLWACWKNDFVAAPNAQEHKALLEEFGQLALRNKHANGLKSVTFFNTDTHVETRSLKTKQVSSDERIVGVPYTVDFKANDLATVYCFGVLTTHGKPQLKISPKDFLRHFQSKGSSNSNAGPSNAPASKFD